MLDRLCELADSDPQLAAALEEVFWTSCNIKLVPAESAKGEKTAKTRSFSERVQKSRLHRPEFLRIVECQDTILEVFVQKSTQVPEARKAQVFCNAFQF